jgi:cell wall-associated NlpC family hydrolase
MIMERYRILILLATLMTSFITSCSLESDLPDGFASAIDSIRTRWVPDQRTNIFKIDTVYRDGNWHITAETSVPEAKKALETVDQVISGMVLKVFKRKSYWYLVQTPTGYIGWVTGGSFSRIDAPALSEWEKARKVVVEKNYAQVFSQPDDNSTVISDAVLGSVFKWIGERGAWTQVSIAGGQDAFIRSAVLQPYHPADGSAVPNGNDIITQAKDLLGIPYLWGGHSSKGFDCSGFTSTVFRMEGRLLPRDANMQAELGQEILPDSIYGNINPGDLIFFGPPERITHVGICLGGSYFIHCSNDVHINSLDETDPLFNAYRKRTFRFIKRL